METRPYVSWDLMNSFLIDAFKGYGVPEADAKICADVLLESDRRGIESHGCNRFKPIYIDRIVNGTLLPETKMDIVKDTPTTVVMDANNGMGMVASYHMMELLIEKAAKYGMAGGAVYNSTHYGIAGYWTTMAEKAGMIGITGTNARPSIAPTLGVENMMGTNPLTFSLPTDEEFPFCIDCATSIVQRGKIEYYDREGLDTPAGMVVAQDGSPMTDSGAILRALVDGTAALAPLGGIGEELGGYKGYGYAAVVEILSAALAGAAGALFGLNYSSTVSSKFGFNTSILILVFVVLGGLGSIRGSIISAALLYILPEMLRGFEFITKARMLIYAIILIAVMLTINNPALKSLLGERELSLAGLLDKLKSGGKSKEKGGAGQ